MTREEAIQNLLKFAEDNKYKSDEMGFLSGLIRVALRNPWHKVSEELPPVDTEVVCKMKGVPHTEHFVCKWDRKYWWHWGWLNPDVQGWFGLNEGWEVAEWKEI